jgi:hypothetical protein
MVRLSRNDLLPSVMGTAGTSAAHFPGGVREAFSADRRLPPLSCIFKEDDK